MQETVALANRDEVSPIYPTIEQLIAMKANQLTDGQIDALRYFADLTSLRGDTGIRWQVTHEADTLYLHSYVVGFELELMFFPDGSVQVAGKSKPNQQLLSVAANMFSTAKQGLL